jgi:Zn-dependent protease
MGCRVWSIEIYPVHGFTRFDMPWSRFDHCIIAWGGVIAQSVVALPLVAWILWFGYTPFEPLNAALAILGAFSLGVAVFNLIPVAPLDGAMAWSLLPEFIRRLRNRQRKGHAAGWRF